MPYRRNNYDFVIDSSFTPFTMQEMLVPFMAYKDAFEKSEEAYTDLSTRADKFKYLASNLDPNSEAAKIYNGYANDLKAQAEDLANNGLSMGNRSALTNLKRRYQGEIGRLVDADIELKKEKELRRQMSAKDPSMLWAADNLTIDNYLDGNTPNLYGISGTELYTKAAAASQAASKRQFSVNGESKTLGGYYYDYVQKMGYNPDTIAKFRSDMSAIPELQQAADDILKANGVTDNLTGRALEQAKQQVINGMIDGAVYSEQHNPQRNLGVMTAAEADASARGWASERRADKQMELSALASGYKREGNKWVEDPSAAPVYTVTNSGNPVYLDKKGKPYALGPDGKTRYYDNDKDGNYTDKNPFVKPKGNKQTAEQKMENALNSQKQKALLELNKSTLANNNGFDVTFGGTNGAPADRHHYNYIGAISSHNGKWYTGGIGEDNPGHKGWGWTSSSNVEDWRGNFSAEGSDASGLKPGGTAEMRVLSPSELEALIMSDPAILDKIEERKKKANITGDPDIQLIEVPNEQDSSKKGYLIAVH